MGKIKITSDSSCSLSGELLEKLQISLIYLEVRVGGHYFQDGAEITGTNLYEYHDSSGEFAEAVPVPTEAFIPFFSGFSDNYDCVIHIGSSLGSVHSWRNAGRAARNFPNVKVADAGQVSSGMGLMVLYAANLAKNGSSGEEILSSLELCRRKIYAGFLIGSMEYFYQSERCGIWTYYITKWFHLHPGIAVANGKMIAGKMYQGPEETVRAAFLEDFAKNRRKLRKELLILSYSGCPAAFISCLTEKINAYGYFEKVLVFRDSAAISSHCGPDAFGMYGFYLEEQKGRGGHEKFSVGRRRRHL